MKLYIDIENLKSLSEKNDPEVTKLIRENFDVLFTFTEKDIEKEKKQKRQKIIEWKKRFSEGRGSLIWSYRQDRPFVDDRFTSYDFAGIKKEDLQSLYLLGKNNIEQNGLLFCGVGGELETLRNLLIEGKCIPSKFYNIRPQDDREIVVWDVVSRNVSPCTDIVINDPYIFANEKVTYDINSVRLISELCKKSIGICVNIVIITDNGYNIDSEFFEIKNHLPDIKKSIKESVKSITQVEPNVTIITIDKGKKKNSDERERLHDRVIFTNYKMFMSGDSFNRFYEKRGEQTISNIRFTSKGMWLGVCSLFDEHNYRIAQQYIRIIENIIKENPPRRNMDNKSNFLKNIHIYN